MYCMSRKRSFFRSKSLQKLNPLSNIDLENMAKELKIKNFRGVFMRDTLPNKIKAKECGIVNLDSIKNEGTHWVCYYKGKNEKYYFDSFGLDPPNEIQDYLGEDILLSTFQIQELGTNYCGHLCLKVLYELNKGETFLDIILNLLNG